MEGGASLQLADIRGIGKKRLECLQNAGIRDVDGLLGFLPREYRDTTVSVSIGSLREDAVFCVSGKLCAGADVHRTGKLTVVRSAIRDGTGVLRLVWFNQPWRAGQLRAGAEMTLLGGVERHGGVLTMLNPAPVSRRGILPVYRALPGLSPGVLGTIIRQALDAAEIRETLPASLLGRYGLCGRPFALRQAHCPSDASSLQEAKRRIAFENLLLYQTAMRSFRQEGKQGFPIGEEGPGVEEYWRGLPFRPTPAQERATGEILGDLRSGRPMRRLVQGDVGSGKTAVAFAAAFLAARAGYQTALMAPTEILARQHLDCASRDLGPLGIKSGILLSGLASARRRETLHAIRDGEWGLVVGTHALLGEDVRFSRLALVITDEQHRFGVTQRQRLSDKASGALAPHVLALSATPIPRTLALILYGDLDVSTIDEVPPGRKRVRTRIVPEAKRSGLYSFIRERVAAGEQAFVVCPLLEEAAEGDAKSALEMHRELSLGPLAGLRIGIAYGSQPPGEKEGALLDFSRGEKDVLVATSVVEVGVNVPGATVMVIENANRFGLSQLHQLRGRVGRGDRESWCFLMAEESERLMTLCRTSDGFAVARKDLELRGPGEFLGTRQHGKAAPGAFGVGGLAILEETLGCARELCREEKYAEELEQVESLAALRYAEALRTTALH